MNSQTVFLWQEETAGKDFQLENAEATLQGVAMDERVQAELCTIGIPREPWDFVERAVEAGHPRSLGVHLSENVMDMLRQNFSEEPYKLVKGRAKFLHKWTKRCKELEKQEQQLHEGLEGHLKSVLKGKRLLVFQDVGGSGISRQNTGWRDLQGFSSFWLAVEVECFSCFFEKTGTKS